MKKKKGTVVIAGYYGFGNAGDDLILASLLLQLRRQKPDVEVTVLSFNPEHTSKTFNVEAVDRWNPGAWIRTLWKTETFILGGGGLLQETTGVANHLYYLSLVVLAKLLSCRTEIRSLGVDPTTRWFNRVWTRWVINNMTDFISVRDADSQRILESIGVQGRIWRVSDPVFHLTLPKLKTPPLHVPTIAWVLSPWTERPGWDLDLSSLLERVSRELGVPHDLVVFFPEQDEALNRKVSQLASCRTTVRMWEKPEDLLAWIQEYDMVISMRYHALVLAALAQKTFIGWGFQRKIRTLCRDFSQPMWTFERGWDTEVVLRQICDAWRHQNVLPERYKDPLQRILTTPAVATETARIYVASA